MRKLLLGLGLLIATNTFAANVSEPLATVGWVSNYVNLGLTNTIAQYSSTGSFIPDYDFYVTWNNRTNTPIWRGPSDSFSVVSGGQIQLSNLFCITNIVGNGTALVFAAPPTNTYSFYLLAPTNSRPIRRIHSLITFDTNQANIGNYAYDRKLNLTLSTNSLDGGNGQFQLSGYSLHVNFDTQGIAASAYTNFPANYSEETNQPYYLTGPFQSPQPGQTWDCGIDEYADRHVIITMGQNQMVWYMPVFFTRLFNADYYSWAETTGTSPTNTGLRADFKSFGYTGDFPPTSDTNVINTLAYNQAVVLATARGLAAISLTTSNVSITGILTNLGIYSDYFKNVGTVGQVLNPVIVSGIVVGSGWSNNVAGNTTSQFIASSNMLYSATNTGGLSVTALSGIVANANLPATSLTSQMTTATNYANLTTNVIGAGQVAGTLGYAQLPGSVLTNGDTRLVGFTNIVAFGSNVVVQANGQSLTIQPTNGAANFFLAGSTNGANSAPLSLGTNVDTMFGVLSQSNDMSGGIVIRVGGNIAFYIGGANGIGTINLYGPGATLGMQTINTGVKFTNPVLFNGNSGMQITTLGANTGNFGTIVVTNGITLPYVFTNFVINTQYSNPSSTAPVEIMGVSAGFTEAAVAGISGVAIYTNGVAMLGSTNQMLTAIGGLTGSPFSSMVNFLVVPSGNFFFTNISSGAGNSATVSGGQLVFQ